MTHLLKCVFFDKKMVKINLVYLIYQINKCKIRKDMECEVKWLH